MGPATLGGVPGAGEARSRSRDPKRSEWRGMFFFDSSHDASVEKLANARAKVVFEGLVDGQKRKILVSVMGFTPGTGTVSFDGSGELV